MDKKLNVYVAASWRTDHQPAVVKALREAGHEVYDYRNPPSSSAITWSDISPWWAGLTPEELSQLLSQPVARGAFEVDMGALRACDACVLLLPSGRSSHLELGWAAGAGKRTAILLDGGSEAELMSLMADRLCEDLDDLLYILSVWAEDLRGLRWPEWLPRELLGCFRYLEQLAINLQASGLSIAGDQLTEALEEANGALSEAQSIREISASLDRLILAEASAGRDLRLLSDAMADLDLAMARAIGAAEDA